MRRLADWVPEGAWLAPGYAEWLPPEALRGTVARLWARVAGPGDSAGEALVLPDGCSDLVWEQDVGAYVAGPDTGPVRIATRPGLVIAGVRFRPSAGGAALGLPLSEIRDQRVGLPDLLPDVARRLPATLPAAAAAANLLDVAGRLVAAQSSDHAVARAAALLRDPSARTEEVAAAVGLSERQLRRRCHAAAGYGPKTLQRVFRFQRFVRRLDASGPPPALQPPLSWPPVLRSPDPRSPDSRWPDPRWPDPRWPDPRSPGRSRPLDLAAAATESGYADQAHLTRECAALSGLTPTVLARTSR